jgi:selenocysteine lyase/cysteine desulfurase
MTVTLEALRQDTRGISSVVHLNNAGASLPPSAVVDAVIGHVRNEEALGPYEAATKAGEATAALYGAAAQLLDCDDSELAFCDSGSRAWNVLVYSLRLQPMERVLVSPLEFGSGLVAIQHVAERAGASVVTIPADDEGRVRVEELATMIAAHPPALVAITHAAPHGGAVNPVREIGTLAKECGAFYLVDACQSLGQLPVSVHDLRCDALTATGRKWLRGPRGTAFLYVRRGVSETLDPTTSDLLTADFLSHPQDPQGTRLRFRSDARKFELWERSVAGAIGLGVALEYLRSLIAHGFCPHDRILDLAQYAADGLRGIPGVEVWAPAQAESGIVGFAVGDRPPAVVKSECSRHGINISTMSEYDVPLDFQRRQRSSICRVAPHYFNETSELDAFLSVIRQIAST